MDGKTITDLMLDALDTPIREELFNTDPRVLYQCLDRAAIEFCRETRALTKEIALTTVAAQQAYDLPPDFIGLYLKNPSDRYIFKYYDGSSYSWTVQVPYEQLFRLNLTTAKSSPSYFAVIDKLSQPALITGTTTSAGAVSAGQCTLTDSTKLFLTTNLVYPRDIVHNTSDKSDGIVLSVTDATQLVTALFKGMEGQNADWSSGDAYVIQRSTAKQIFLDAPSETAGHTITLPYTAMPDPVYSDYGFWRLPAATCHAIACEAAFFWQNRKGKYQAADRHHVMFINEMNRMRIETARSVLRPGQARQMY